MEDKIPLMVGWVIALIVLRPSVSVAGVLLTEKWWKFECV